MYILGLTGSIGMGKSTVARFFSEAGAYVFDADQTVHTLYQTSDVLKQKLNAAFGDVFTDNQVDRLKLSTLLKDKPDGFIRLNEIVHPLVKQERESQIKQAREQSYEVFVMDVPLLFEINAQEECDGVLVVSADARTQKKRVLARPNMTQEKFELILSRQMSDFEKRKRADFIILTDGSLEQTHLKVLELYRQITQKL